MGFVDDGAALAPGVMVRHPDRAEWGIGQVQSAIGSQVTVNFPHRGKVTINADVIALVAVDTDVGA